MIIIQAWEVAILEIQNSCWQFLSKKRFSLSNVTWDSDKCYTRTICPALPITVDSNNNSFIRWTSFIGLLNSKSSARRSLSDFLEDGSDTSDTDSSKDWDGESQPSDKHHNNQDVNKEFKFLQFDEPTIEIVSQQGWSWKRPTSAEYACHVCWDQVSNRLSEEKTTLLLVILI